MENPPARPRPPCRLLEITQCLAAAVLRVALLEAECDGQTPFPLENVGAGPRPVWSQQRRASTRSVFTFIFGDGEEEFSISLPLKRDQGLWLLQPVPFVALFPSLFGVLEVHSWSLITLSRSFWVETNALCP